MYQEIFGALLGYHGTLIAPSNSEEKMSKYPPSYQCTLLAQSKLTLCDITVVNQIVKYGGHVTFIHNFVGTQMERWQHTQLSELSSSFSSSLLLRNKTNDEQLFGERSTLYLPAMASAVNEIMIRYEAKVCTVEEQMILNPTLGVSYIYGEMESEIRCLPVLTDLILASVERELSKTTTRGTHVLETLHRFLESCGDEKNRSMVERIEQVCRSVLFRQISSWVEEGRLVDTCHEFFVEMRPNLFRSDPASSSNNGVYKEEDSDPNHVFHYEEFDEWILKPFRVPSFLISLELADKIFFVGKIVRSLKKYCKVFLVDDFDSDENEFFKKYGFSKERRSDSLTQQSTLFESLYSTPPCTRTPLVYKLEEIINMKYHETSKQLYELLLCDHRQRDGYRSINILSHLENMRRAFLLGDSQLFTMICEKCDKINFWTKFDPKDSNIHPLLFQQLILNPVLQDLYECDSSDIHSRFPWKTWISEYIDPKFDFVTRLSVLTIPKYLMFQKFGLPALQHFTLKGLGAKHDSKNNVIILSSPAHIHSSQEMIVNKNGKIYPGCVLMRAKQKVENGTVLQIQFHMMSLSGTEETKSLQKNKGAKLSIILSKDHPLHDMSIALGDDDDPPQKMENYKYWQPSLTSSISITLHKFYVDEEEEEYIKIFVNGDGSRGKYPVRDPKAKITLLILIHENSIDVELSNYFGSDGVTPTPPHQSLLMASKQSESQVFHSGKSVYVAVGARSTFSVLHKMSIRSRKKDALEKKSINGEALRLAAMLAQNSDKDIDYSEQKEAIKAKLQVVHETVVAKHNWLDCGGIEKHSGQSLLLQYKVDWPHRLILHSESMETYNRIFHRMFTIERASYEIHQTWSILLKYQYRLLSRSDRLWLVPLWATRTRMDFFLRNLLQYWKLDVVGSAHHVLVELVRSSNYYEPVLVAHARFLGSLRSGFFLDSCKVSESLQKITTLILRFTSVVRCIESLEDIPSRDIRRIFSMFDDESTKLFVVLQHNEAIELCSRLDFNNFFHSKKLQKRTQERLYPRLV